MTRIWMKWACAAALSISALGCVSQKQYDDLQTLYRRSQEQILDLRAQLEEKDAAIRALQRGRSTIDPEVLNQLQALQAERDQLVAALAEAKEALRRAVATGPVLPEAVDRALMDLAAQHPELMSYDPNLGMVKFRSDLTFDLGSAEVKPRAGEALRRLAGILGTPDAAAYEARIVGHTDNVPISQPATRAKHPTNWHLSVHRAIAVKDVLERAGVPAVRLGVGGHSQYRPVVPNPPRRGEEANRRVEIYLVPLTYTGPGAATEAPAEEPAEAAPRRAAPAPEVPEAFK